MEVRDVENKIIHFPDKDTQKLQAEGAKSATEAGHPITEQEANPEDHTPLVKIREALKSGFGEAVGDAVHVLSTSGTILGGEEPNTFTRTTKGEKPSLISKVRERLKKAA